MQRREFLKTTMGAVIGAAILPTIAVESIAVESAVRTPVTALGTMYVGMASLGVPRGLVYLMKTTKEQKL